MGFLFEALYLAALLYSLYYIAKSMRKIIPCESGRGCVVVVSEINKDGTVLVRDEVCFPDGIFIEHPAVDTLAIGQELVVVRRNDVWQLID